jgi:hypothetical protein
MNNDDVLAKINQEAIDLVNEYEHLKAIACQLKVKMDIAEYNMHISRDKAVKSLKKLKKVLQNRSKPPSHLRVI